MDFSGKKAGSVWSLRGSSPAGNQAVFQKDRMAAKGFESEEEAAALKFENEICWKGDGYGE